MDIAKEKRAIEYLKAFQPEAEPYYLCYSGGKDSDTILTLADLAGVKYEAVHNLTTVDAPETVNYVKSKPNVRIEYPHTSMWNLIVDKGMPPTRLVRYCCEELKEQGGKGRLKVTGVRKDESRNRAENGGVVKFIGKEKTLTKIADEMGATVEQTKKGGVVLNMDNDENRRFVERCYRTSSTMVNPIIDWTDDDVLEFLAHYGVELNPLYEAVIKDGKYCLCGKHRVGCIGCPIAQGKGMKKEFLKYPKYRDNYLRAFKRMQDKRIADGLGAFGNEFIPEGFTPQQIMMWWVGDNPMQYSFETPEYLKGAVEL